MQVVAQVSTKSNGEGLPAIIRQLLSLFLSEKEKGRDLIADRSGIIIKELCLLLDPEIVYLEIGLRPSLRRSAPRGAPHGAAWCHTHPARSRSVLGTQGRHTGKALESLEDAEVASALTERLTMILLTVPDFAGLRRKLLARDSASADSTHSASADSTHDTAPTSADGKTTDSNTTTAVVVAEKKGEQARQLFLALYQAWRRYPVSALSLCLVCAPSCCVLRARQPAAWNSVGAAWLSSGESRVLAAQ